MVPEELKKNVALAPYTTFGVGGRAEYFAEAANENELVTLAAFGRERHLPLTILGGGSNVLISDEGVKGLVIKISIAGISYEDLGEVVLITAGAGVVFDELVEETVKQGLWGFENLSSIPGTVGATPVQNVGAYGVEVADLIQSVRVFDKEKNIFLELKNNECDFSYRNSIFKKAEGKNFIVTEVTYKLKKNAKPKLEYKDLSLWFEGKDLPSASEVREAVKKIRSNKFPDWNVIGSAGSFFHAPVVDEEKYGELLQKYPDFPSHKIANNKVKLVHSWFLDNALHLKGERIGSVGTYKDHVLVLVNYGGATEKEIDEFAKMIEEKFYEATGVRLVREVKTIR